MYGNGMMNGWMTMGPLMWIFMILFWGLVIFGLVFLVRWLIGVSRSGSEKGTSQKPLDILKARYARGEISKAQFEQMKKDLEA